jgi:hypothetical protein
VSGLRLLQCEFLPSLIPFSENFLPHPIKLRRRKCRDVCHRTQATRGRGAWGARHLATREIPIHIVSGICSITSSHPHTHTRMIGWRHANKHRLRKRFRLENRKVEANARQTQLFRGKCAPRGPGALTGAGLVLGHEWMGLFG